MRGTRQDPRPPTPPISLTGDADNANVDKHINKTKHIKTVFDFMESMCYCMYMYVHTYVHVHPHVGTEAGPFTLLQTCRSEGRRVRVTLRHCVGVRGVCEGAVLVFDRHMNLVLTGVTEWCTPFRTVSNGGILYTKRKRKLLKQKLQASITPPQPSEGPLPPPQPSEGPLPPPQPSEGPLPPPQPSEDHLPPPQSSEDPHTAPQSTSKGNSKDKWEVCRNIQQLFIRGDNIIHITML